MLSRWFAPLRTLAVLFALCALVLLHPAPSLARSPHRLTNSASGEWAMRHRDAFARAATDELILPPLSLAWSNTYPYGDLMDRPPKPIAADGKIFIAMRSGDPTKSLLAFDPATGTELWSVGFINGYHFTELAYDSDTGRLYAATDLDLLLLDPDDGTILRQTPLPSGGSFFVVSEGNLYLSTDNLLSKYDADGNLLWQYHDTRPVNPHASLAVGDGMVYMSSGYWTLQGFNARTGKRVWESPTNGHPYTQPVLGDGLVFQGMQGQGAYSTTVAAFDARTGEIKWGVQTGFGGTVWTAMSYADHVLYFGSDDQNVYAIDTKTPRVLWTYETVNDMESPVVKIGGLIYAISGCGEIPFHAYLYVLDASTGTLLAQETVPCSGGGLIPYQGNLILSSRGWDTGTLLRAYRTSPGLQLSVSPIALDLHRGAEAQAHADLFATFAFSEPITLQTSALPSGITLNIPSQVQPGQTILLNVSASPDAVPGTYPITLTANSTSYQSSAVLTIKLLSGPPLNNRVFLPFLQR